jgi:hypothetical protein
MTLGGGQLNRAVLWPFLLIVDSSPMQFSCHVLLNFKKRGRCREEKDEDDNEEEEEASPSGRPPPETEEPR